MKKVEARFFGNGFEFSRIVGHAAARVIYRGDVEFGVVVGSALTSVGHMEVKVGTVEDAYHDDQEYAVELFHGANGHWMARINDWEGPVIHNGNTIAVYDAFGTPYTVGVVATRHSEQGGTWWDVIIDVFIGKGLVDSIQIFINRPFEMGVE